MGKYLWRRLVYGLAILVGVNLLTFFLFFSVNTPDDMARLNIGGKRVTQDQIETWKAERGYDKPLYWDASQSGTARLTHTILWERSISLMLLDFGRSDARQAVDIGHEVKVRMGVSLQLAVPLFILQLIISVAFALLLTFFQAHPVFTPADYPGMPAGIERLSVELLNYGPEQLNQLWTCIGSKHLPAMVYRVRMLWLQDAEPQGTGQPVTGIQTHMEMR